MCHYWCSLLLWACWSLQRIYLTRIPHNCSVAAGAVSDTHTHSFCNFLKTDNPTFKTTSPAVWRWEIGFEFTSCFYHQQVQHYECFPGETVWKHPSFSPFEPLLGFALLCDDWLFMLQLTVAVHSTIASWCGQTTRCTNVLWYNPALRVNSHVLLSNVISL